MSEVSRKGAKTKISASLRHPERTRCDSFSSLSLGLIFIPASLIQLRHTLT